MDEENWKHFNDPGYEFIAARRDALLVHDINFFSDCIKKTGAKCHMWHDPFNDLDPEYSKDLDKDIFPYVWMYYSYLKENWTLIADQDEEVRNWYATQFPLRYGYTVEYDRGGRAVGFFFRTSFFKSLQAKNRGHANRI